MTTLRPNYPLVTVNADFTQGPPNVPSVSAMSLDSPTRRTTVREIDITRGRQYELDQVQAGTCDLAITDPLELLHPANTTSPFNTGGNTITSYRCMQVGAWWNPASGDLSGNLLNAANTIPGATFPWDPSFESGPVASASPTGVTATSVGTPADGGLPVTQIVTPDMTSMMVYGLRLVPGTTYTIVADVFATTGVTVAMGTLLNGVTTPGTNTTTTGSFQPLSFTVTAAAGQSLYFAVTAATGGFPATFYVAGIRVVGLEPGWNVTFSQTNLTRPGNQSFQPLPSPLPTNPPYGQRVLTQEVEVNDDFDLVEASTFYLKRYGKPTIRVDQLTLNPAANPALWPVVLSLEISQRITVKRRTSAGLVTTADYYIEQINHSINGHDGSWLVQLQCSPVFNNSAWILGDPTFGVLGSTTIPVY